MEKELITEVLKLIKNSINVASEQSPEIVEQWLKIQVAASWGWIGFFCVVLLVAIGAAIRMLEDDSALGTFIFILCFIPATLGIFANAVDLWSISHAPKAFLLEKLILKNR